MFFIAAAENCTAGDKSIGTCACHRRDIVNADPAVDFETNIASAVVNHFARLCQLAISRVDKFLPAKSRIDRHQ